VFTDLVDLTAGLPERRLEVGEHRYDEGDDGDTSVVLVSGELVVEHDGEVIDRHTAPGTVLGELGALLHRHRNATIRAVVPTVVRDLGRPSLAGPGPGIHTACRRLVLAHATIEERQDAGCHRREPPGPPAGHP
jgi:hypothetical protein